MGGVSQVRQTHRCRCRGGGGGGGRGLPQLATEHVQRNILIRIVCQQVQHLRVVTTGPASISARMTTHLFFRCCRLLLAGVVRIACSGDTITPLTHTHTLLLLLTCVGSGEGEAGGAAMHVQSSLCTYKQAWSHGCHAPPDHATLKTHGYPVRTKHKATNPTIVRRCRAAESRHGDGHHSVGKGRVLRTTFTHPLQSKVRVQVHKTVMKICGGVFCEGMCCKVSVGVSDECCSFHWLCHLTEGDLNTLCSSADVIRVLQLCDTIPVCIAVAA